jgi:hypothetical protein
MSEEKPGEAFLDRWSRRKKAQVSERASEPGSQAPAEQPPAETKPAAPLPAVESLKPESDYTPFMAKDVQPATRRAALKQLFTDAHFNLPDPFEPYSGDYTISETIPEEMLKSLNHVSRVLFDEKAQAKARAEAAAQQADAAQQAEQAKQTELKDVAGKQDA